MNSSSASLCVPLPSPLLHCHSYYHYHLLTPPWSPPPPSTHHHHHPSFSANIIYFNQKEGNLKSYFFNIAVYCQGRDDFTNHLRMSARLKKMRWKEWACAKFIIFPHHIYRIFPQSRDDTNCIARLRQAPFFSSERNLAFIIKRG